LRLQSRSTFVEGYDGDGDLAEEGIDSMMSFLKSGNNSISCWGILARLTTADQTPHQRRYWLSAVMMVNKSSNSLKENARARLSA
jgi:hypothetical protein